jgi:chitin-binding protein
LAGNARFNKLNEQSLNCWPKTNVQAVPFAISWHHEANHATTNWQYFLTKQDWNPNAPLSRSLFDDQPFYTAPGFGNLLPDEVTHNFNLSARTGYQVILAVWTISDTGNTFYNMNNVLYGGGTVAPPSGPSPPHVLTTTGVMTVLALLPPVREGHRVENGATLVATNVSSVAAATGAPAVAVVGGGTPLSCFLQLG